MPHCKEGDGEMEREIGTRQLRCAPGEFRTARAEDGNMYIEGYFAVFNSDYVIGPGMSESIAPGAFSKTLGNDIRCLTDHDTRLVIGRTSAETFEVREDEHGLWGRALVNPNDQDALNTKARVDRGDVNQASIGFNILSEDTDIKEDGSVHWTIREIDLHECSVVTFPAYEETNISARSAQKAEIVKRQNEAWREKMKARLSNGTESVNAEKED